MNKAVIIDFDTQEQAQAFISFMSGHGEQVYWEYADHKEDYSKDGYVDSFKYDMGNQTIRATNKGHGFDSR